MTKPSPPLASTGTALTDIAALAHPQRGPARAGLAIVLTIALLAVAATVWAHVATLEIWASGIGRVIPSRQVQVVQNLEGGIVSEVLVREGDIVSEGEIIARIDATDAESSYLQDRANWIALTALTDRLSAEAAGQDLVFSEDLRDGSAGTESAMASERAAFAARKEALASSVAVFDAERVRLEASAADSEAQLTQLAITGDLIDQQIAVVQPQVEKGLVSQNELLRLQRERADLQFRGIELQSAVNAARNSASETVARMAERIDGFRAEAFAALSEKRAALAALSEKLIALEDRVVRRVIKAPAVGVVKRVLVTTTGEVVKPGDTIVEIVPTNDDLLIEARIRPQDIGFVRVGQKANIRLTAYDSSIYGAMSGRVERVGADTLTTNEGQSFYLVTVRADDQAETRPSSQRLEILPGMIAEVSIVTGERTILDYVFKPILKLGESAFRDR